MGTELKRRRGRPPKERTFHLQALQVQSNDLDAINKFILANKASDDEEHE